MLFSHVLAIVVFCALIASCSAGSGFNAAITLEGQVEDEEGRPLEQVRLDARENRVSLVPESFLSSSEATHELEDGRFRIKCRSCSSVELSFSKDNYYSETESFHVGKAEQPGNRLSPEVATDLTRTDLRIVLRSSQNKARLVSYSSFLSSSPEGPVTVAPLRRGIGAHVKPERLSEPLGKDTRNLPGHVRLLAAVTDKGTLAANDPSARSRVPAPAVLDLSNADGGVVLH